MVFRIFVAASACMLPELVTVVRTPSPFPSSLKPYPPFQLKTLEVSWIPDLFSNIEEDGTGEERELT